MGYYGLPTYLVSAAAVRKGGDCNYPSLVIQMAPERTEMVGLTVWVVFRKE